MRVALFSDLHGHEVAVRAVLRDIARCGVDQIVCLGDVATLGPHPRQVLALLRDLNCLVIEGNHDAFMTDVDLIKTYTEAPVVVEAVDWCRDQLAAEDFAQIRTFRRTASIEMGGASLLLYHGTPRSHMEDLLATASSEQVDVMLGGAQATVLAGGHTHIQMLRQHRGMLIVNPGSTGMPFRQYVANQAPEVMPYAEYAIVDARGPAVSVELKRVAFDLEASVRDLAAVPDFPMGRYLQDQYAAHM